MALLSRGTVSAHADDLAFEVPAGMSAVVIHHPCYIRFVQKLHPGDHLDIWATYQSPNSSSQLTNMLMQGLVVLTVDEDQTNLTVAVRSDGVELITAGDRSGALCISVRKESLRTRLTEKMARDVALQYLRESFPGIDPKRFVFQEMLAGPGGEVTLTYAAGDSQEQLASYPSVPSSESAVYARHYSVRLDADGDLIGIQQIERRDGILKIFPAPDYPAPTSPLDRHPPVVIPKP